MRDLTYITADTWGRDRDASLWIDVPARMLALGLPTEDRAFRQRVGRQCIRELLEPGITGHLIVAKVDG
jgi:hypothetical protein